MSINIKTIVDDSSSISDLKYVYNYVSHNKERIQALYTRIVEELSKTYSTLKRTSVGLHIKLCENVNILNEMDNIENIILDIFTDMDVETTFRRRLFTVKSTHDTIFVELHY